MAIKFFWNGMKADGGRLQRAHYSIGAYTERSGLAESTITIYAKDGRFSKEVRDVFTVENESDMMTDYFEDDTIRVAVDHPLYAQVKAALDAKKERYAKMNHRSVSTNRPGDQAAIVAEESGMSYGAALVFCNMD